MVAWRTLASLIVGLVITGRTCGQTNALQEAPLEGSFCESILTMESVGGIRVQKGDKQIPSSKRLGRFTLPRTACWKRPTTAPPQNRPVLQGRIGTFAVGDDRSSAAFGPIVASWSLTQVKDQLGPIALRALTARNGTTQTLERWPSPDSAHKKSTRRYVENVQVVAKALCISTALPATLMPLGANTEILARFRSKRNATGNRQWSFRQTLYKDCRVRSQGATADSVKWKQTDERDRAGRPAMTFSMTVPRSTPTESGRSCRLPLRSCPKGRLRPKHDFLF